ncbi:uncharacterized protein JCM15063_004335 [Sporobolomyces koalae]|uniref:uncharacterized protein n=1 Tax=Sporobolomyces koalae TaxID=500713 RepID=UPI0031760C9C
MEMIAHRHDRAIHKLERAVELRSAAACATLANLYSKGYCRRDPANASTSPVSPTGSMTMVTAASPSLSSSYNARPRMPVRSTSWNCQQQHRGHRSPDSLRATELYLRGLEFELDKPVEQHVSKRPRRAADESSSEEERAEGKYWNPQSALDLIIGVTDAHRFGVLQPPSAMSSASADSDDTLWHRSSRASSRVLSHPTIANLLSSIPTDSDAIAASTPTTHPSLSRSMSSSSGSRRAQSVSRSYTHPATTILEHGTQHNRKLSVTIAVHALYILALQAFASPCPQIPEIPTPDSSPLLIDSIIIAGSPSDVGDVPIPETETGKRLASTLFDLILRLAPITSGPIGIKEGDELVSRAQRRLDDIKDIERPGRDDWKLVKKKHPSKVESVEQIQGHTLLATTSATVGHEKERSDTTITPGTFARKNSKFHFADEEQEGTTSEYANAKEPYPSPPDTPPAASRANFGQLPALDTDAQNAQGFRSPPLASPLKPRYHALHSQSSSHLTIKHHERRRRDSLSSFQSSTTSILSRFKHDPAKLLLRRVESSTSICTVPPDFGATRLKAGDKGKGKAIDPHSLDSNGFAFGRGEISMRLPGPADRTAELERADQDDLKVGKSWLSRFFSVSGLTPVREKTSTRDAAKDRLEATLKRDQESQVVEYVMDWGDDEIPTEDEDENEDFRKPPSESEDGTHIESEIATAPAKPLPRSERPKSMERPALPRRHSSKQSLRNNRSFTLNDPTSDPTVASDSLLSPNSASSRSNRTRHRRHASSTSSLSSNHLSPLSAANPKHGRDGTSKKKSLNPVSIDPLLLELERSSRVGVRTVCQSCHKKGLNFPACRSCGKTYCSRVCRVGELHECVQSKP